MRFKLRIQDEGAKHVRVTVFCDPGVGTFAHLGVLRFGLSEFDQFYDIMIVKNMWIVEDQRDG